MSLLLFAGLLIALQVPAERDALGAESKFRPRNFQQTEPARSSDERTISNMFSLSPYAIEWLIDIDDHADLNRIWRRLGIDVDASTDYRCKGDCDAETFDINASGEASSGTVVLKIHFESAHVYQYLFFKRAKHGERAGGEWKFIGNIDSNNQRTAPPQHRIERGDERAWFAIREQQGQSSGGVNYIEKWYEIEESQIRQVLSYPVQGDIIPCQNQLGRAYKSIPLRHDLENGVYTIPVQFMVSYNISDCSRRDDSPSLFAKGQKAYFVWNAEKKRFALDRSRSEITDQELNAVYSASLLSAENFIEYNFNELLETAKGADRTRKDWLTKFLASLPDSARKTALQQAIQK